MDAIETLAKLYGIVNRKPAAKKKPSMIKDLISCPDDFELHAKIEDGEIVIRIRRNEESEEC